MAYDYNLVLARALDCLGSRPRMELRKLAAELGVSRHTLERVFSVAGITFREARRAATFNLIEEVRQSPGRVPIKKQIAFSVGFPSASAFSHFLARATITLANDIGRVGDPGRGDGPGAR